MADFNTHIFGAAALVSFSATCCTKLLGLTMTEGIVLTLTGIVGGILPDIDLKQSQPSRALFSLLGIVAALAWLFFSGPYFSAIELWLSAVAVFCCVRYPLWAAFHHVAHHRGALHSLIAALMWCMLMCCAAWQLMGTNELQSWLLGLFMLQGYLIHLALDELYSVDFMGARIKRSFGTALKLANFNDWQANVLVLFITGLAWAGTAPFQPALEQWQTHYSPWKGALLPDWLL